MAYLLATIPMSATAQSEATCVAYMEADAAWEARYDLIHREYREASEAARERFWNTFRSRKVSWDRSSAQRSQHENNNNFTGRNGLDGWLYVNYQDGDTVDLNAPIGTAFRDLHHEYKTLVRPAYDIYKAEGAVANDRSHAARDKADQTRMKAYLDAYEGTISQVSSVMTRLLDADRERCRVWYGG